MNRALAAITGMASVWLSACAATPPPIPKKLVYHVAEDRWELVTEPRNGVDRANPPSVQVTTHKPNGESLPGLLLSTPRATQSGLTAARLPREAMIAGARLDLVFSEVLLPAAPNGRPLHDQTWDVLVTLTSPPGDGRRAAQYVFTYEGELRQIDPGPIMIQMRRNP